MLAVTNVSKRFGDEIVLDRVSLVVNATDRIGLVGPNGAGKSTLLAIMAGALAPDGGAVATSPGERVGYLRQGFADLPTGTLATLLDGPLHGLLACHQALDEATLGLTADGDPDAALAAYERASERFETAGGYAAVEDIATLLAALGLSTIPFATPLTALSGGEKTRAGLAALLASRPAYLLLDEPTNHLDMEALEWLESFVQSYRGAAVIVSHDRAFIDATVATVAELDDETRRLSIFPGGYSDYLAAKERRALEHVEAYRRQQEQIARIERDVRDVASHARRTERQTQNDYLRGRAKKVARTAKVRERKLARMLASEERIERPERRWGLAVDFERPSESGRDVAMLDGVSVERGGREVLCALDLFVRAGERVVVSGPNGAGKSTLLGVIAGTIAPTAGSIRLGAGVVPGIYAQEQGTIDLARSPLEHARALAPLGETEARTFLHLFLFAGDMVMRPSGVLSYGERARLQLAMLVLRGANLLLLDEPLNHLDLTSRDRFEEALLGFEGTFIAVLHDRYAIDRLATRLLVLDQGQLRET